MDMYSEVYYLPNSLKHVTVTGNSKLHHGAFSYCTSLMTAVITGGMTRIEEEAFIYCSGLLSITIPESMTSIHYSALRNLDSLIEIVNYSSLNITTSTFTFTKPKVVSKDGSRIRYVDGYYFLECDDVAYLFDYDGTATELVLPESFNGKSYEIDKNAFEYNNNIISVVIPNGVSRICKYAFYNCKSLKSVYIGGDVSVIEMHAFESCRSLDNVTFAADTGLAEIRSAAFAYTGFIEFTIPASVTVLESSVFASCYSLKGITFAEGSTITELPDGTFYNCKSLAEFIIPDGITRIGANCFYSCYGLMSVTIGKDVTDIGEDAFYNCSGLIEIINHSSLSFVLGKEDYGEIAYFAKIIHTGESLVTVNGDFAFIKIGVTNYLISYLGENVPHLVLPESCNGEPYRINRNVFRDNTELLSITVPAAVQDIEHSAFGGCTRLIEIINNSSLQFIPGATNYGNIAANARVVHKGDSVLENVDGYVFYTESGVSYLVYYLGDETCLVLPESYNGGTYEIYPKAFYENDNIGVVMIPAGVTAIGKNAFAYCKNLTAVVISDITRLTEIGDYAFWSCYDLSYINIPKGIVRIGEYAFGSCSSLDEINLPEGIVSIGGHAFSSCTSLKEIIFPESVTEIGASAFQSCTSFVDVVIPDSVIRLEDYVFAFCDNLWTIHIPDSISYISESAFYECYNIAYNEYDNVYYLGNESNPYLMLIKVKRNYMASYEIHPDTKFIGIDAFAGCNMITEFVIPEGVTAVPSGMFSGCYDLQHVIIPEGVTRIGLGAFDNCARLTSISLPDSVTHIDSYAFEECTGLTEISLGKGLLHIGSNAFYKCTALKSIEVYDGLLTLGDGAFYLCTSLVSVVLPANMEDIGSGAFFGCTALESITVPFVGNNKPDPMINIYVTFGFIFGSKGAPESLKHVTVLGGTLYSGAFTGCSYIETVILGDTITSIPDNAFSSCTSLKSVTFGNNVTSIGGGAFYQCKSLENIVIPEGVTGIDDYTFGVCSSLVSITFPASVTYIGENAFSWCTSLEEIIVDEDNEYYMSIDGNLYTKDGKTLLLYAVGDTATTFTVPDGVTTIAKRAFFGAPHLKNVVIPEGVVLIDEYAFYSCSALESIVIPVSVNKIGKYAFDLVSTLKTVYYGGTASMWSSVTKEYGNTAVTSTATKYYYSESAPATSGNYWHYDESGKVVVW